MAKIGYLHIPQEKVNFIFDRNLEREYNATYLYDYMFRLPEWKFQPYIGEQVAFACRKNIGVQAADLVARETMKHLDNQVGPKQRLTRASLRTLEESKRFTFNFYIGKSLLALAQAAKDLDLGTKRKSEDQL
ncbi:MAG: hypothetical protein WAM96_11045, partial [Candidatus Acidiferrales bacterium]